MSGSGIIWAICRSAPRSREITMPAPHHSVFYRPDALPAARPCQSIEALQFLPTAKLPEHHSHSCINELHPRRIPAALSSRPAEFLQHLSPLCKFPAEWWGNLLSPLPCRPLQQTHTMTLSRAAHTFKIHNNDNNQTRVAGIPHAAWL